MMQEFQRENDRRAIAQLYSCKRDACASVSFIRVLVQTMWKGTREPGS
jgi:hypothetical protein